MNRMGRIGPGLAVLLVLAAGACRETGGEDGASGGKGTSATTRETDFFSCTKSSDCVVENQRDCCPCNAGGNQVAVLKKTIEAYRAARAERCTGDLLCPQVYLCDDTATALCLAGKCALGHAGGPPRSGGRQDLM